MTIRTLLRIELCIDERWGVGGVPESWSQVAQPILVDPRRERSGGGHPAYLPMTSLAGSLARHLPEDMVEPWLGRRPGAREDPSGTLVLQASRLALLGTVDNDAGTATRGVTAIDPRRAAAADLTRRSEEWAEPVTVHIAAAHDGGVDTRLLDELASWTPHVGRKRGAGQGSARVTRVEAMVVDLGDAEQLAWWLTDRDSWWRDAAAAPPWAGIVSRQVEGDSRVPALTLTWKVTEPVRVGTGEIDGQPGAGGVAAMVRDRGRPFVPGSSWKGVFRHRVEAILSVADADPQTCGRILERLFGSTGIGRGMLWFSDSRAPSDAALNRSHIAIDRFSGGVRDGALFQLEAMPRDGALVLEVRTNGDSVPDSVLNLLRHVAADIDDGLVPVGGNGARGYGSLTLSGAVPQGDPKPLALDALVADLLATTAAGGDS